MHVTDRNHNTIFNAATGILMTSRYFEIIAYSVELIISDYYMPTSLIVSRDPTVVCLAILKYRSQHDENAYTHILYTLPTKEVYIVGVLYEMQT